MALCRVLLDYAGWKKGDHIEAFDNRLTELVQHGIVQIITPDKKTRHEKSQYVKEGEKNVSKN